MIPKKSAYMDDKTGEKLVKVVAPGIRNSKASNVAGVLTILLSIYLTIYSCISKLSADDMWFTLVVEILHILWILGP